MGETSRPLRMRAGEHHNKLNKYRSGSLILFTHWMKSHGLNMIPPRYTFKILGTYTDCLSRQIAGAIHIEDKGILNRRSEFGVNHLPKLEAIDLKFERNKLLEKKRERRPT